ncbi:MAG: DUF1854 domain-containing protein [Verrucomicrobiota bacterium]
MNEEPDPPLKGIRLERIEDQLLAHLEDNDQSEPQRVCLVYARPISDRETDISVMDLKKKKEVFYLHTLDDLDPASRREAQRSLRESYPVAVIHRVTHTHVAHGHRYLKVETDRGFRYFNLKEPGKNVTYLSPDHLIIRDSMGNRFEIPSIEGLDEPSRQFLDKVL